MGDAFLIRDGPVAVPLSYQVPAHGEMFPLSVRATLDGTNAGQPFYAVVQLVSPSGRLLGNYITTPIAAGGSADVTWFPGGELDEQQGTTSAGSVLTGVASPLGTLEVANGTGPTAQLDIATTGVTAGTYGDASNVAQVTVNAEGQLTAATAVGIAGLAGTGLNRLFDSTLSGAAAAIDTGAGGIAAGHDDLVIVVLARTADAAAAGNVLVRFNNDSGANYYYQNLNAVNATVSATANAAQTSVSFALHGNGGTAAFPGVAFITIPSYDQTTFAKTGTSQTGKTDATAANSSLTQQLFTWNNTAAITRVSVTGSTANLQAGSRLTVYGTQ